MYFFAPLDTHFDKGFGAIADSFFNAAVLLKEQHNRGMLHGHLPICFSFRHAIELFLKGSIIIVHSSLELPYGNEPHTTEPKIPNENGKLKSIYSLHDIDLFYAYLSNLLVSNKNKLCEVTNTDWAFDVGISDKFKRLKEIDPTSSYFRYPMDKNAGTFQKEKSAFKRTTLEAVMSAATKEQKPMKTMKVVQILGGSPQIFVHDDSFTAEIMDILHEVAEEVSACHYGLMNELAGGGIIVD